MSEFCEKYLWEDTHLRNCQIYNMPNGKIYLFYSGKVIFVKVENHVPKWKK